MSFEERINRMEAAGTITATQAEDLRASTGALAGKRHAPQRCKPPLWSVAALGLIVIGVGLIAVTMGNGSDSETIQDVSKVMNEVGKVGAMNKGMTTGMSLLMILLPLVLSGIGFVWIYNDLVGKEEDVLAGWSQVESNYQRRADLVPNLIETVRAFVSHEEKVLSDVTQSRQKAMDAMRGADTKLEDETALSEMARTQKALGDDIIRLFGLVENYPQLRSADNFLALQDQIEGAENRINAARMLFNESVRDFNSAIRKMPGTLIAGMGGFKRKAYFEAETGADTPVEADF